jgi:hypothetical protein
MKPEDLIHQYISIGTPIPAHQLKQLSANMLKTYTRQRLITAEHTGTEAYAIKGFEYEYFNKEQIQQYLAIKIKQDHKLTNIEFGALTDELRLLYYNQLISQFSSFSEQEFKTAPDDIKYEYLSKRVEQFYGISQFKPYEFEFMPLELRERYLLKIILDQKPLNESELSLLTDEQKVDFFTKLYKIDMTLSYQLFKYVDDNVKANIITKKVASNQFLKPYEFNFAMPEEKKEYINYKIKTNKVLTNYEHKFAKDNGMI